MPGRAGIDADLGEIDVFRAQAGQGAGGRTGSQFQRADRGGADRIAALDLAGEHRVRIDDDPVGVAADDLHRVGKREPADGACIRHGGGAAADVDADIDRAGDHTRGGVADRTAGEQDHTVRLAGDRTGVGHGSGGTADAYGVMESADLSGIADRSAGPEVDARAVGDDTARNDAGIDNRPGLRRSAVDRRAAAGFHAAGAGDGQRIAAAGQDVFRRFYGG